MVDPEKAPSELQPVNNVSIGKTTITNKALKHLIIITYSWN